MVSDLNENMLRLHWNFLILQDNFFLIDHKCWGSTIFLIFCKKNLSYKIPTKYRKQLEYLTRTIFSLWIYRANKSFTTRALIRLLYWNSRSLFSYAYHILFFMINAWKVALKMQTVGEDSYLSLSYILIIHSVM